MLTSDAPQGRTKWIITGRVVVPADDCTIALTVRSASTDVHPKEVTQADRERIEAIVDEAFEKIIALLESR